MNGNGKGGGGEDDVKSPLSVTGVSQRRQGAGQWLTPPLNQVEAELDRALDQAAAADTDEVALRRVWSRLAQIPELVPTRLEMPSRRTRWPWIAAASFAGAAAAVTFMLLAPAPLNRARNVVVAQGPSASAPLHRDAERSRLVAPATVRTGNGEVLHLALKGGTEVTVTSNSALVLDEDERPTVSAGEVQFHVPPQPAGHTFSVRASGYRVVVVGTRFRVRVSGNDAGVGVEEGIVEVWNDDRRLARLTPGQSWESTSTVPSTNIPAAIKASETNGNDAKASSSKHLQPVSRSLRASHGLRASLGAVAGSPASSSGTNSNALSGNWDKTLPLTSERPSAPTASDTSGAPAPPTVTSPSVAPPVAAAPVTGDAAALAAQARAARAAGDPRKALGIYRLLAQRGGAAGENAEYESGRILRDNLHQPREAIAVWRGYRAQHPRGLLRIESDISLIETLVVVNDKTEALSEAQDFIRRFPDNERRAELGGLAGDLLREQGDFRGALTEYDGALDSGRGRRDVIDALSFHRSVCVLHLDRELGESALRAYLQVFPVGHFRSQADRLLADQSRVSQANRP